MASGRANPNLSRQAPATNRSCTCCWLRITLSRCGSLCSAGLDEFFFPKKLPPLKLESKPEPVKDIWGFYNYKKNGALGSTVAHVIVIALIIGGTILGRRLVTKIEAKPQVSAKLIDPGDFIPLKPAKTQAGGGGGGGDRDVLQASQGKLPKVFPEAATGSSDRGDSQHESQAGG